HLGAALLGETLPRVERGEATAEAQDNGRATYAPMLKREDGLLDWRWTAGEISNRVRAFQPWPGVYTTLEGHRLHLWRAREVDANAFADRAPAGPGTILQIDQTGVAIACASGSALLIEECQIEGKRRVAARDFANGARLTAGDRIADVSG